MRRMFVLFSMVLSLTVSGGLAHAETYEFVTEWGSCGSGDGQFGPDIGPRGCDVDNLGSFYVVDYGNQRIQIFSTDGTFLSSFPSGYGSDLVYAEGHIYFTRPSGNVCKYNTSGTEVWTTSISAPAWLLNGICLDSDGDLHVCNAYDHLIYKLDTANGNIITTYPVDPGPFQIAASDDGYVYVTLGSGPVHRYTNSGTYDNSMLSLPSSYMPQGIDVDADGNIFIGTLCDSVFKYDPDWNLLASWGGSGSGDGEFSQQTGICVDSDGFVFVSDGGGTSCEYNRRIQVFHPGSTLDALLIPSISDLPCDDECVVQPVQIQASDAIAGATIPIEIPAGVEVCGWSREGLVTEDWDFVFDTVAEDYALINLANLQGDVIEPGTTTVAYLLFHAQPECQTSYYIHWDTTLSDDPSKQLKFSDAFGQAVNPGFDPGLDSTEILGFTPGDFGNDGSVDIADLVALIDYMFRDGPPPCVMDAVDVNGDCGGPDIADLVYLINYMFLDGPAPVCGCISSGVAAKVVAHPEVMVTTSVDNGVTTISLSAPFDLRGLDLQLAGPDGAAPVTLLGDGLDMVYGQEGDRVKIGILDLDGANVIPAGDNRVIQLQGEYEIVSAFVATDGYHTYAATIGESAKGGSLPSEYALGQNYPNPFNPVTTISFSLPVASHVSLEVYNVMGQRVTTVADGFYEAGVHACEWDGSAVASGVYFYRIETPEFVETKKMMLLK